MPRSNRIYYNLYDVTQKQFFSLFFSFYLLRCSGVVIEYFNTSQQQQASNSSNIRRHVQGQQQHDVCHSAREMHDTVFIVRNAAQYGNLFFPSSCSLRSDGGWRNTIRFQGNPPTASLLCFSLLCYSLLCPLLPCPALPSTAVQYSAVQCSSVQCSAVQCGAVLSFALLCYTPLCPALPCPVLPCPSLLSSLLLV
jgi:hypothetical protein